MKKIINGKKYDTATATEIAAWDNGCLRSDFSYCEESLYRKRTGEFFIHGRGGAMTKYSERCGNSWCDGEAIIPLSIAEAKAWMEDHCDVYTYEGTFGEVEE